MHHEYRNLSGQKEGGKRGGCKRKGNRGKRGARKHEAYGSRSVRKVRLRYLLVPDIFAKDLQSNMQNHETRITTLTSYLYPRSSTISSTSRPLQAGVTPSVQPSRMQPATSCTVRSLTVLQIFRQASLPSCLASLQIPACSKIDSRSNIIVQFPKNRTPPISQRDFH